MEPLPLPEDVCGSTLERAIRCARNWNIRNGFILTGLFHALWILALIWWWLG